MKRPLVALVCLATVAAALLLTCRTFLRSSTPHRQGADRPGAATRALASTEVKTTASVATTADPVRRFPVFGPGHPATLADVPAGPLHAALLRISPAACARALAKLTERGVPFADLASLHVDADGELFYACIPGHGTPQAPTVDAATGTRASGKFPLALSAPPLAALTAAVPVSQPPIRHSRPASTHTLFLDFRGATVTGTQWNTSFAVASWSCLPYDTDGDRTTFSAEEQAAIVQVWERVAEDFRPFDVDVTTEPPAALGLGRAQVLITTALDAASQPMPLGHMGGVAYLDVFGGAATVPAFVYFQNMRGAADIAEVVSHETGHMLGLSHDGTSHDEYYGGHGVVSASWSPIMGVSYGRTITQWSKGEYYDASNPQDDIAIITAKLGLASFSHGETTATAVPLTITGALARTSGTIGSAAESDFFSFSTGAGTVAISVDPFVSAVGVGGGNLHVAVELLSAAGAVLNSASSETAPNASLSASVAAGSYYLRVFATGMGNPLINPPTGYSTYDSRGQFTVTATIVPTTPAVPLFTLQPQSTTANSASAVTFTADSVGTQPITYQWQKNGADIAGATSTTLVLSDVVLGDQADYTVIARNSAGSTASAIATLTVPPAVVTAATKEVGAGTTSFQLHVETTGPWTAQPSASWVTVGTTDGIGARNLLVTVAANYTGASRTATIQIGDAVHTVRQRAAGRSTGELWALGDDTYGELGQYHRLKPSAMARNVRSVAAAFYTNFFIKEDGSLWAFGQNTSGQLGDGSTTTRTQPIQIATNVAAVAPGSAHTLFLKADGTLWAMGELLYTQADKFGAPRTPKVPVQLATGVRAIASGLYHGLFLKNDGTLWGMGEDRFGQLGQGTTTTDPRGPVQIASDVTAVAAGDYHTLFVKSDKTLWSVGANTGGNLGDGTITDRATPVMVASNAVNVWAGYYQSFFTTSDNKLWAMGRNEIGQLGDGTFVNRPTPVQVDTNVALVAAGWQHVAYVRADGGFWVAGAASGFEVSRYFAVPTRMASGVKAVAAAYHQTLYVASDGTLWVIGNNDKGLLGDSALTSQWDPLEVAVDVQSAAAGMDHSLFIKSDGTLWGMGRNSFCQLGDGTTIERTGPIQVASAVRQVASGYYHVLFIGTDDTLWAMGFACAGELGDGANLNSHLWPVLVASGVKAAAGGAAHTLFVKNDGTLWATGSNNHGQLGDGTPTNRNVPYQIATGVAAVAAGGFHSLFLKTDGSLWGVGRNDHGQLGDGTTTDRLTPVLIAQGVQRVQAGEDSTYFLKTDGTLWATGLNYLGQIGNGTITDRLTPVQVAAGVSDIAAGQSHALFLKTDRTVWGMGANGNGQLGRQVPNVGGTIIYSTPVKIASGIQAIAAGGSHSLLVAAGDSLATPASPALSLQPSSQVAAAGQTATLSIATTGTPPPALQWSRNGSAITGATAASLVLTNLQPGDAGIYAATATNASGAIVSTPVILGVTNADKVSGAGREVGANILHANGNIYDQVLLTGAAATVTADGGQVTRTSFIDLTNDLVQVEFSGAGTLSLVLDSPTGPATPANYNQPTVTYMKGHLGIVITGADETTNLSVFSIGRLNAFDPTGAFNSALPLSAVNDPANNGSPLFQGHAATVYDGTADLAFVAIQSPSGKFGGLRASNASFYATKGITGVFAPGIQFAGPVFIGDINAFDSAAPAIAIGGSPDTRITGGDLLQTNGAAVQVTGLTQLKFTAGIDSHGHALSAKTNRGTLRDNGMDVTSQIVVNPTP